MFYLYYFKVQNTFLRSDHITCCHHCRLTQGNSRTLRLSQQTRCVLALHGSVLTDTSGQVIPLYHLVTTHIPFLLLTVWTATPARMAVSWQASVTCVHSRGSSLLLNSAQYLRRNSLLNATKYQLLYQNRSLNAFTWLTTVKVKQLLLPLLYI